MPHSTLQRGLYLITPDDPDPINLVARTRPLLPLASCLRLQAYRYDMKGLVLSPFGNASFAGVSREKEDEVKKP